MARQEFTWSPDLSASRKVKPAVQVTKFGDGYESRTPIGINTMGRIWSVKFSRGFAEANAILDFIEDRAGVEAFTWVDPRGTTGAFVCREWEFTQSEFGVYVFTGDFEEVFEPE